MLWLLAVVLAVVHLGSCWVPEKCPGLGTNTCYFGSDKVGKLQPNANSDYYAVGGLFNIHQRGSNAFTCGTGFSPAGLLHSQAFLWSLDYWQKQISGTAVSVGAVVFDSCYREDQMIQNLLGFEQCNVRIENIDRYNLVGFVGTTNTDVMAAARLTSDMDLTLISPSADSVDLDDIDTYPYFLRTVPSIKTDVEILAEILEHVETKYVAAIYQQSHMATFNLFKDKMKDEEICITAQHAMTGMESVSDIRSFVDTSLPKLKPARYIALFLSPEFAASFMSAVTQNTDTKNMNLIFLMTAGIQRKSALFAGGNEVAASNAIVLERDPPADVQAALDLFRQSWNASALRSSLNTAGSRISNPFLLQFLNSMTDDSQLPAFDNKVANTILATKAFVNGVYEGGENICQNRVNYLCSRFFSTPTRGSDINQNIRKGTDYFTPRSNGKYANGNLRADKIRYSIYRYLDVGGFAKVGEYSNDALTLNNPIKNLSPYNPGQCQDSPCLQCGEMPTTTTTTAMTTSVTIEKCKPETNGNFSVVYYPSGQEITGAFTMSERMDSEFATRFKIRQRWIIALGVLAGLGILAVIIFEIYILYKLLGTPMGQKWRTMWLGQLLLFGILLCYLTLFAYLPIPTKATCGITRFGVGVSYSICFAVLLVKLMVILTSKTSENTLLPGDMESPNYLKGIYQFLMFVFVVGVQVVIDTQWLITVPPEAIKVTSNSGSEVWICNHYTFKATGSMGAMTDMASFVRNEFENHVLSLVYIMFLILITTFLSLNAHGIITNHRESVFIGIASGFSIPIWLAWTLVGGMNKDHDYAHEFSDACIAFGLFLTATLILFAMFLPKVRQLVSMGVEGIYFEDDRDTVYAGSVIMAPPSYKSRPNSVIYVNNQGIYSDPVIVGNGDPNYLRHPGSGHPTPASTYSAPPTYLKKGADSSIRGGSVLRVTDDLSGRRPLEKKRPMSEVAYGTASRPRSTRGTLPRSRSNTDLGAL